MAPKRSKANNSSSSDQGYVRFLDEAKKKDHYEIIRDKRVVQERSIEFPNIVTYPRMRQITVEYGWVKFNNMIGSCIISWVKELYANSYGCADDDYKSYVHGVDISYAPDVIDGIFGFRPEEHYMVMHKRAAGLTEQEFDEILQEHALPGKDWYYSNAGERLHAMEMETIAKAWAN
ncbi:hypothetical protein A2U01_0039071, partial [Trifolium medium]|nr:hypothetical protein [Trifolium medium]